MAEMATVPWKHYWALLRLVGALKKHNKGYHLSSAVKEALCEVEANPAQEVSINNCVAAPSPVTQSGLKGKMVVMDGEHYEALQEAVSIVFGPKNFPGPLDASVRLAELENELRQTAGSVKISDKYGPPPLLGLYEKVMAEMKTAMPARKIKIVIKENEIDALLHGFGVEYPQGVRLETSVRLYKMPRDKAAVIIGLPTIQRLLAGSDVELDNAVLMPDSGIHNAQGEQVKDEPEIGTTAEDPRQNDLCRLHGGLILCCTRVCSKRTQP